MRFAVVVLLVAVATGCSAPDPGAVTYGPPRDGGSAFSSGRGNGNGNGDGQGETPPDTGGTKPDAGGAPAADAGARDTGTAGPVNGFTGAKAFEAGAPTDQSANHHAGQSNAGQNCLTCHVQGGLGTPPFTFAGTIYKDQTGAAPAVNAEVRLVSSTGALIGTTYSDNSGNFWWADPAVAPATALTGGRDGANTKLMIGPITSGACNGCHIKGTATPVIFLQ